MSILGCDVSHHNKLDVLPDNCEFVICKATEGATYRDPATNTWIAHIAKQYADNLPIMGFYHFARPENCNTPQQESFNFLNATAQHHGKCIMALDIEADALNVPDIADWASEFIERVNNECHTKCFLYTSASALGNFKKLAGIVPLWVAHYNVDAPRVLDKKWFFIPYIWQFTSKPFDINLFYGGRDNLAAIATGVY